MYYPSFRLSLSKVKSESREELCQRIESLYGWSWGEGGIDEEDRETVNVERLREDAERQTREEFRIPEGQLQHYPDAEGDS